MNFRRRRTHNDQIGKLERLDSLNNGKEIDMINESKGKKKNEFKRILKMEVSEIGIGKNGHSGGNGSKHRSSHQVTKRSSFEKKIDGIRSQNIKIRIKPRLSVSPSKGKKQSVEKRVVQKKIKSDFFRYSKYSITGHKFQSNQDRILCSNKVYIVCDGHGKEGHSVSSFVSQKLLQYSLAEKQNKIDEGVINSIFHKTNQQLQNQRLFDIKFSGSTALLILIQQFTIYCANSGDCRAIIGKKGHTINLSTQHRPNRIKERKRILAAGGSIRKSINGCYRLSNPEFDLRLGGLSVSRGFGDTLLTPFGLIYQPQISKYSIDRDTDFLIIGSDGFFQFFEPSSVIEFTYKLIQNKQLNLAQQLCKQAHRRWQKYSQTDDISCVIILF